MYRAHLASLLCNPPIKWRASILQIKELLGHADIQTTSMYLHLTHAQVLGLKSPLDLPFGGDDLG
ncbi:hypothetical protein [Paenibacillus crassostreae]|uniref:hypothetical protein n=1 Tax=Paenibacillus crassostreae TaxID=1763538 RepID=UPI00139006F7|nr:hypothetical protein [Paenibacillus crassostreae]